MEEKHFEMTVLRVSGGTVSGMADIEETAEDTGLHPDLIRDFCHAGYIQPHVVEETGTFYFDERSLYLLRRIRELRDAKGVNMKGIRIILGLIRQLDEAEVELRYLRDRLL